MKDILKNKEFRSKLENKNKKISSYIKENKMDIENVMNDYANYVYTIIRNSCVNLSKEDIEEIVLDVFFTFWKNLEKLDVDKNIAAYIGGITKNLIKKKCRSVKTESNIDDFDEQLVEISNIELHFIKKENEQVIIKELEHLKKIDKDLFIKYYYEEKSIKEIAQFYSMSESKVKSKLFRIRKKIKKLLKERGYDIYEK